VLRTVTCLNCTLYETLVTELNTILAVLSVVMTLYLILFERKLLAFAMRRIGPVLMGRNGAFQIVADLFKLLSKETYLIPRPTSLLAPVFLTLFFACQVMFSQGYIWGPSMFLFTNVDSIILYHLSLVIFSNILFSVIGLISQSRYAVIAVARSIVHVISLDIFITVVYSLLVFSAQSANFHDFIVAQSQHWFILTYAPASSAFIVIFLLESKRTPFDHAETESEVVSGYSTEYNGAMLLFLYLTEYIHLVIASIHFVIFFLGGWYPLSLLFFIIPPFFTTHSSLEWLSACSI